ncbi:hypothetical protein OG563_11795 [Nocardia vinacea]|uniref:Secreted protein n=1 Tax=Nocardia vinacea TaxID=96468 RepID=A0ABZ1YZS9_9NOCA|nr:hypothetical protein [Nocardia vinacea]
MSSAVIAIVVVVVVVFVVAGLLVAAWPMLRRKRLRKKFGPEYDRTMEEMDSRKATDRELTERERRHAELDIRELSEQEKQRYRTEWAQMQEHFVDAPADAVTAADVLVADIMAERGYPTEGYDQQLADLSVEHAATVGHYRAAHEIAIRRSDTRISTEDMRFAVVQYRELFEDLLGGTPDEKKEVKQ